MNNQTTTPTASPVALSVKNVHKSYGKTKALDDVSFDLQQGFYALLGPNGAGKSTLFQLLTGLFVPDTGSIEVSGIDISKRLTNALANIGIVFQQPALDLDLTVQANLTFHGRLRGMSTHEIKERSHDELSRLKIDDIANKTCRTLSGGNRRKVELVRALLGRPKVLLMDEATVGLDPASRDLLMNYVHELCVERKMSVLWATHLIDEAEQAEQVLVLNKGKLLEQGNAEQLCIKTQTDNLLDAFLQLSGETVKPTETRQI
ncbi:MAG: ABC-2 type transport system ATP-binding protein [uncultured Thiotrichaceae bacterium]|uniref:ABC-2 type transport system ATP-binding protein n=1 Tax=uncultured Thiotrichaceae bacterium TaxID=298394 RepID=A0A6S6UCH9_9GAMM|nr:MAG: ABC-2 type transport system ATP-binding protein [uncultured Thiotrichaceae bacterium]